MQIISPKIPYIGYSRNSEHDYLFNKLVEAITQEFATKHNFLAYHQRMTAALADENASYTRTTKYVDTDTLVQKDNARDNLFRRLKLHLPLPPPEAPPPVRRARPRRRRGCRSRTLPRSRRLAEPDDPALHRKHCRRARHRRQAPRR